MGTSSRRQPQYVSEFLQKALLDEPSIEVQLTIGDLIRDRSILMPLSVVADLLRVSHRTMKRLVSESPDMRAAGIRTTGRGRTKVYPFWVMNHLFHSGNFSALDDDDEDEDDEEEDNETPPKRPSRRM